jgi:putative transcriptional regulator
MIQFRLRELMAKRSRETRRKITYDLIFAETGISKSTLAKIANNKAQFISINALDQLCTFFGCQPGDLLLHVKEPGNR